MKLATLFSGGKDSTLALYEAQQLHDVVCLIGLVSQNPDSYMFHTPNNHLLELQAQALNTPIIIQQTQGEPEVELHDLKHALQQAIQHYHIQGVVTGAVESVYQATRIQQIAQELNLTVFNPLWQRPQVDILQDLIDKDFDVIITAIAGYPLDESWLGKPLNQETLEQLNNIKEINPAGEGGEYESLVLNGPNFANKLLITETKTTYKNHAGKLHLQAILQ